MAFPGTLGNQEGYRRSHLDVGTVAAFSFEVARAMSLCSLHGGAAAG